MNPLAWQAYEFEPQRKGADWYWALGIIALSVAATAVIFNNVIFGVFVIVGALSLMAVAANHPGMVSYGVDERGVVAGRTLYPFETLESYWIDTSRGPAKLILKSRKLLMTHIVISIPEGMDPARVRRAFSGRIAEVEHEEPLSHRVMEYLGF
jgi:hypothetical protein